MLQNLSAEILSFQKPSKHRIRFLSGSSFSVESASKEIRESYVNISTATDITTLYPDVFVVT